MALQELDEVRQQRRQRTWYKRRDLLFIGVVLCMWIAWQAYGRITAPGRMTETLQAKLANDPETVSLIVTAKFQPERFHSNVYNEIGVQRGTEGNTTLLVRVPPANVYWLARQYWIESIDLAPKDP